MSVLVSGSLDPKSELVVVILAGGQGTRFWPLSRAKRPKQFLALGSDSARTLLQLTADRTRLLGSVTSLMVVTAESQIPLVREQVQDACILAEPVAKNTAASLSFAAEYIKRTIGDVPMLCLPSDHVIDNVQTMKDVFARGISIANSSDSLVTFGITPTQPETGFGYILKGDALKNSDNIGFNVEAFVEKPNRQTAESYLASRKYLWNSGMFVWRPSVLLKALAMFIPETAKAMECIGDQIGAASSDVTIREQFAKIASISIDYGVLEKAKNVVVVAASDFGWSDVGSWDAWADHLASIGAADENGTVKRGSVIAHDCHNSAIVSQSRLVAAIGLENIVIVETEDAVLVCTKEKSQDVKLIVDALKQSKQDRLL